MGDDVAGAQIMQAVDRTLAFIPNEMKITLVFCFLFFFFFHFIFFYLLFF